MKVQLYVVTIETFFFLISLHIIEQKKNEKKNERLKYLVYRNISTLCYDTHYRPLIQVIFGMILQLAWCPPSA